MRLSRQAISGYILGLLCLFTFSACAPKSAAPEPPAPTTTSSTDAATSSADAARAAKLLPERAFEVLKTNDVKAVPDIAMTRAFVIQYAKDYNQTWIQGDQIEKLVKRSVEGTTRSLKMVRDETDRMGFDWSSAELKATEVRGPNSAGGRKGMVPYDPASKESSLDVYLTIVSGTQTIVVKLDDCGYVNGDRRLGDGFRLEK